MFDRIRSYLRGDKSPKDTDQLSPGADELIDVQSFNAEIYNHLHEGYKYYSSGSYEEAEELYLRALDIDSRTIDAYYFLGKIYGKKKLYDKAIIYLQNALSLKPDFVDAIVSMGNVYMIQGHLDKAESIFQQALDLDPNSALALCNIGRTLNQKVDLSRAETYLKKAIFSDPNAVDAYYELGQLKIDQKQYRDAFLYFQKVIELSPGSIAGYLGLGTVFWEQGKLRESESILKTALELKPDNPMVLYRLGLCVENIGLNEPDEKWERQINDALVYYRRSYDLNHGMVDSIAGIGRLYERQGKIQESYSTIEPFLNERLVNVMVLQVYARICNRVGQMDLAIEKIRNWLHDKNITLDRKNKQILLFSLGNLLDKKGKYAEAFAAYKKANDLIADGNSVNIKEKVDAIITVFDTNKVSEFPISTHNFEQPIFIVGAGRSGTTLVEQIIASHPKVYGCGELKYITHLVEELPNIVEVPEKFPQCMEAITQKDVNKLSREYISKISVLAPDALRFTDKMPLNFLYLGLISLLFPKAKIINCRRNPLDLCLSLYFQDFEVRGMYVKTFESIANYYRQYEKLMRHWKNVLRIPVLDIGYEALVDNIDAKSREIIEFCGLEWNENCLDFHKNKRVIDSTSYDQVRTPLYRSSIGRWRNYEDYIQPLKIALGETLDYES